MKFKEALIYLLLIVVAIFIAQWVLNALYVEKIEERAGGTKIVTRISKSAAKKIAA